eukprot:scaffold76512_cov43-Phaeocystis_antarctica.AAC.1
MPSRAWTESGRLQFYEAVARGRCSCDHELGRKRSRGRELGRKRAFGRLNHSSGRLLQCSVGVKTGKVNRTCRAGVRPRGKQTQAQEQARAQ